MPPEQLDPADHEGGGQDSRPEHYAKRGKRLIPARQEASQQLLNELQLVHDLSEVVAGLSGLAEGEALGVEVIGDGPITNPDVVNDRFTVSPPTLSADAAKRRSETRASSPVVARLSGGGQQPADQFNAPAEVPLICTSQFLVDQFRLNLFDHLR
jgi:hypothetical protein